MKKVLWLASWYPNKISPLNGDFVQRHAEALAIYQPVHVIFVVKDGQGQVTKQLCIENFAHGNLSESIVYYKPFTTGLKPVDRFISIITYCNIFRKLIGAFIKDNGYPRLVHVHIAMWSGIIALWLKKRKKIPYLLTEHWTGYHKNAIENIYTNGWFFKKISLAVLKNADLLIPDSAHLGDTIHKDIWPVRFKHLSNVVDTDLFKLRQGSGNETRFIHVSAMSPQKNTSGLLEAFSQLVKIRDNCRLIMAGPASEGLKAKAKSLGLDKMIDWLGTISYKEVAAAMAGCSALVMFSNYENEPCVILEALCCGLPVISTDVGGIPQVINESNGILVSPGNEHELLQAMMTVIDHYQDYNANFISEAARKKYNYETVGRMMWQLYGSYFTRG
jgi:glycosyltransferase involved in cell wall biosynthesis